MKQIIRNSILIIFMGLICNTVSSQGKAIIKIDTDRIIGEINPNIYGSFVEPLFDIVYGRLYDPSYPFSNEDGFRKDLIELTKELHVPVIRWPGGNYVSGYRWEDGIGPKANRPVRIGTGLGQSVSNGIYHIQRVNAIDSRLKQWLRGRFGGVSTKYLQKYLNWFRAKELLKQSTHFIRDFTDKSLQDIAAINHYKATQHNFEKLCILQR